jgi:5-methylcytosine-specific restriction protein B
MNDAASIIEQFLKDAASGNLKTRHYPKEFQSLQMKVSFGQGGLAKVPWIAFLRDGQQVQNGIYPVYLRR